MTYNALTTHNKEDMKTANLTVRIDPDLKRQAQGAAEFLDLSLSQVVTAALRGVIRQSAAHREWLGEFKAPQVQRVMESDGERYAADIGRKAVAARIAELTELERRNTLNKHSRAELKALRTREMGWGS